MTDFARLVLTSDTTGLKKGRDELGRFTKAGADTEKRVTGATRRMSAGFGAVASAARQMVVGLGAVFAGGAIVNEISTFETAMSAVGAITRATEEELGQLRNTARTLGETTEFSAAQAADGLRFLGMAGFTAAEGMQAIPAVLDLATASSLGLAQSADIASNVLSGFGMQAGQAGNVADVLAAASSRANTSVTQLGGAMSTAAPIAASLGIDLETTAAAIGVMSDAGIQGERAGTAMRGVLASLAGPTKQARAALAAYGLTAAEVNPETNALADVFALLRRRGLSTADAMTIFGREAASGALVLVEGSERLREFSTELGAVDGAVAEMAGVMRDNLGGDIKGLQSALSGLILTLGDAGLTAILRAVTTAFTQVARGISAFIGGVSDIVNAAAGFDVVSDAADLLRENTDLVRIAAMGTAAVVTGMYLPALVGATGATLAWVASLITLRGALMATGIGALVVGAGMLIDFLIRLRTSTDSWGEAWGLLKDVANESLERIGYGALALEHAVTATWLQIKTSFLTALADMGDGWQNFASLVGSAMMVVPGMGIAGQKLLEGAANSGGLRDAANAAAGNYIQETAAADALWRAAKRPMKSMEALRSAMDGTANSTSGATEEARKLNAELENMGGGDGGAAGSAADEMDRLSREAKEAAQAQEQWSRTMSGHFDGLITGGRKFGDVLQSIARQLESSAWQQLFSGLGGGLFGGGGGAKKGLLGLGGFLGFLDSGGNIGAGQWAIAGERRPELVTGPTLVRGPASVVGGAETARMMRGQQSQPVQVHITAYTDPSVILEVTGPQAVEISQRVASASAQQQQRGWGGQAETYQARGTTG